MTRRFTSNVAEPYPRGLEFGQAHASQVGTTVEAYLRLFGLSGFIRAGDLAAEVDRLGFAALDRIEAWSPELAAEIRGIAAGAGVAAQRIAAINARTEILAALQCRPAAECSTVVTVGTVNGAGTSTRVAMQNWDWYRGDGRQLVAVDDPASGRPGGHHGHRVRRRWQDRHHRTGPGDDVQHPAPSRRRCSAPSACRCM